MNVLILNHNIAKCGVYQYGLRLYEALSKSKDINFIYNEVESLKEYNFVLSKITTECKLVCILYNYHISTMTWLNNNTIQKKVKNLGIIHESYADMFDLNIDIGDVNDYVPRPIFEDFLTKFENTIPQSSNVKDFIEYTEINTPIIGSFGFGFDNKGFEKIVKMVNEQYDRAIIKLLITPAHFGGIILNIKEIYDKCVNYNVKPNVKLMIMTEFITNEELLLFLMSNTINIFLYDYMHGRGLSSVIDYVISVKTPIGISDSYMFRHIYSDEINLYKKSIQYCIDNSKSYCESLFEKNTNDKLISKMKKIIRQNCTYGQAFQDLFVISVTKQKKSGYFLEIGSNDPIKSNNTYLLETCYNWKGVMVEYDRTFLNQYLQHRPNSIHVLNDATQIDYRQIMDTNNFPINCDYLQIDLDVNNKSTLNTLFVLDNTIFDKYKFATITFEHDIYSGDFFDTRNISRQILKSRGYELIFPDVCVFWEGGYKPFEDWYVHPELVDMNYINKIKTDLSLSCDKIKEILYLEHS